MKLALLLLAAIALQAQYALWVDISGEWRIQQGDRPEYAAPGFDDNRWDTIQLPHPTRIPTTTGFWLRKRLRLPADASKQALALTLGVPISGIYEVYWNGRRIAHAGTWGDLSTARIARPRTFPIPPDAVPADGVVQLALRASRNPFQPAIWTLPDRGPYLITSLAQAPSQEGGRQLHVRHTLYTGRSILGGGFVTMGFLTTFFWLIYPKRRDLLWFGLHLIVYGGMSLYIMLSLVHDAPQFNRGLVAVTLVGSTLATPILATFVFTLLGTRSWWWYVAVWAGWGAVPAFGLDANARVATAFSQILPSGITATYLVWHSIRHRAQLWEDRLLYGLLLFQFGSRIHDRIRNLRQVARGNELLVGPYGMPLDDLLLLILVAVILALLLRRIAADRRDKQRLEDELAAARTVQQLLIPVAAVPGVEAVYEPAQEVGGDFYQVRELDDGSLLVVTGDISGKGLKAAMMVSLLVGAVKNRKSDEPAAILAELNRVAVESLGGGFATAIAARIFPDGTMRVANAGHLAPYHGGAELAVESGLPLGIDSTATYDETTHHLQSPVTFLSDGVVEAATATGELFGFDRTAAISAKPAKEIAAAAKAWGQNDDITVVTVRRSAA